MVTVRPPLRPGIRWKVFERDGFQCTACGKQAKKGSDVALEVDHVTPVAAGGGDDLDNLATLCADCNRGKGSRLPGKSKPASMPLDFSRRPHWTIKGMAITPELRASVKSAAKRHKMSQSDFIAKALQHAIASDSPPAPDAPLANQERICEVLQQLLDLLSLQAETEDSHRKIVLRHLDALLSRGVTPLRFTFGRRT